MRMQFWKPIAVVVFAFPLCLHGQGFGLLGKKSVTINRLMPPTVNLVGKKIRIEASAGNVQQNGEELRSLLKTKLLTLVQKDPRFVVSEASPETILRFTVTNFYAEKWTIGAGTRNAREAFRGKIEIAYQALDVATNTALDSENLVQTAGYDPASNTFLDALKINKQKAAAEGSINETRDQLIDGIVAAMGKRISPSDEPFTAPLPAGKLEPLTNLAMTRRWGALEEQAEQRGKLPKAEEDTFRRYLVALAKEAQAYDLTREANERDLGKRADISAKDAEAEFERAQKYLDDAAAIYKEILTANPKEKEFRPGDARTEEAVAIYAKIARYKEENAKAQAALKEAQAHSVQSSRGLPAAQNATAQSPLEQILTFCGKGMALDSIKEYIASGDFLADAKATNYKFSFARDSVSLNDACKQNAATIQRLMRERLGQRTGPKPAPAGAPVGAHP